MGRQATAGERDGGRTLPPVTGGSLQAGRTAGRRPSRVRGPDGPCCPLRAAGRAAEEAPSAGSGLRVRVSLASELLLRLVDRAQQILESADLLERKRAVERWAQELQFALGQQADGDDRILPRHACSLIHVVDQTKEEQCSAVRCVPGAPKRVGYI